MGRSLNYPGMGWLGHVGIATRQMTNSSGMSTPADQVIEILNEPVIGQINTIDNFKKRSSYWGSKYGVIGSPQQGYNVFWLKPITSVGGLENIPVIPVAFISWVCKSKSF